MDTITVLALAIAVVSSGLAYFFFVRSHALSRAVDSALDRIGGNPPKRRWHRKKALEEALRRLERSTSQAQRERTQLAGALQAATLGIIITDDHGVVIVTNKAADESLGTRQGEALTDDSVKNVVEQSILNRRSISTEIELHSPVRRILEIAAVPLDFGVESVGAVAYVEDITEHRRVEAMRRDFIANVSHQLRAPLSALAALCGTIADNLDDVATTQRLASQLRAESTRLSALVDSILELSQVEALASQNEVVQASTLTVSVGDLMQQIAVDRGVELIVDEAPASARVSGDQRQLRTMLVNIVENAIEFSIPIANSAPPRVWLRVTEEQGSVIFTVQDEGAGIPQDQIDRIFERFYRVDRDRPTSGAGTGLGLSVVRHVARSHGGDVAVTSKQGEGTVFAVTLPAWKES